MFQRSTTFFVVLCSNTTLRPKNILVRNIAKGTTDPRVDSCDKNMQICSSSPLSSPPWFNVQSSLLYPSSRSSKSHGFPYLGLLDESVRLAPVVRLSQLIIKIKRALCFNLQFAHGFTRSKRDMFPLRPFSNKKVPV